MSKKEYSVPTLWQHTVCCEAFLGVLSAPLSVPTDEETPEVNGEEGGAKWNKPRSVWDDDDEEEEYE